MKPFSCGLFGMILRKLAGWIFQGVAYSFDIESALFGF